MEASRLGRASMGVVEAARRSLTRTSWCRSTDRTPAGSVSSQRSLFVPIRSVLDERDVRLVDGLGCSVANRKDIATPT
jgi:hypothetical protein